MGGWVGGYLTYLWCEDTGGAGEFGGGEIDAVPGVWGGWVGGLFNW